VRNLQDPAAAAKLLVDHALSRFSTDNLSCMIVRFDKQALLENQTNKDKAIGVEGDTAAVPGQVSEAEKILSATKAKIAEGGSEAVGVSASNSGKGHDPVPVEDGDAAGFVPTVLEGPVEEEPASIEPPLDAVSSVDQMQVDPAAKDTSQDTPPTST
jgi:protein phosphatase PTC1